MDSHSNKYVVGIFNDDELTLKAAMAVKAAGVKIHEVYSPFPIHGIDPVLGYKRSRLDIAAFMFGCTGLASALCLQGLTLGSDWPMNIGGKPHISPVFIPVAFELTVLFTALGMVATFFLASSLGPGSQKTIFDPRATDDKFVMAINIDNNAGMSADQITEQVRNAGASEVYIKEIDE